MAVSVTRGVPPPRTGQATTHAADESLWARYRAHRDPESLALLFDRHVGLVHHAAHALFHARTRAIELEDLIGAGMLGLIQAFDGYEPLRGNAFSTYAMPRVRGAMLDEIGRLEWAPRSVRTRRRLLNRVRTELQQRLGRAPDPEQLARVLGVDLETYWRWVDESDVRRVLALDEVGVADECALHELIPAPNPEQPGDALAREETLAELREALQSLSARDRMVLTLYFYEGLTLREIGAALRISESRASQIRTRALARLRQRVTL